MILIPKYKEMFTDKPVKIRMGVGGEVRLIVRNSMGGIVQDTGWFKNTLLDGGLLNMGNSGSWATYFHLGSSNAAVSESQSALVAWLGQSSSTTGTDIDENLGTPDYEGRTTRGRRFPAGTATGTIREVGISSSSPNTNLSIRALVTPEVNKASDQVLDMFYRFTTFPNQIDTTGSVTIEGILYNYIARSSDIDQTIEVFNQYSPGTGVFQRAYDGNIGTVLGAPTGQFDSASSVAVDSVSATTSVGTCAYHFFLDLGDGNPGTGTGIVGGIRSIVSMSELRDGSSTGLKLQVQFGTGAGATGDPIPKVDTKVLNFDLKFEWSRH